MTYVNIKPYVTEQLFGHQENQRSKQIHGDK